MWGHHGGSFFLLFVFPLSPIFTNENIVCTGIYKRPMCVSVSMCAHVKTLGRWTDYESTWVTLSAFFLEALSFSHIQSSAIQLEDSIWDRVLCFQGWNGRWVASLITLVGNLGSDDPSCASIPHMFQFLNLLSRPLADHLDGSLCRTIMNVANKGMHSVDADRRWEGLCARCLPGKNPKKKKKAS